MKVVILCGGLGTRLSEETQTKPKPMVKIGSKPIIWHLIKYYQYFGFNNFILATGYKSNVIKKYFENTKIKNSNIKLVYTGKDTLTGGRILRLKKFITDDEFLMTYGDGLSNINLKQLISFHHRTKSVATLTAVRPPVRFGEIKILNNGKVDQFKEKPQASKNWINGGFFIMNKGIFNYLENDKTILERQPLETLAKQKKLSGYRHFSFWQCMDTMRDKNYLNKLWKSNKSPWKKW
tara:strand:- start:310 stop:1017 length:708 start_codon:yes stop_codon:yes gene_type:complete